MEYDTLASAEVVQKTSAALTEHGFMPITVNTKEEALEKIKELIPAGASVMNGSSTTLNQIGFVDYLKAGKHSWDNLHAGILGEADPDQQARLRRQSVLSDYYLGSAHAVTETGELVFASFSGSQLPHLAYTSPNIILVLGVQKIVPTLGDAFARIDQHVVPLEDVRMKQQYGPSSGTLHAKTLVLHKEPPMMGRAVHLIFVNEVLGF